MNSFLQRFAVLFGMFVSFGFEPAIARDVQFTDPDIVVATKVACIKSALPKQPRQALELKVQLGNDGQIQSLAELLSPGPERAEARLDYLIATAALETCAPFDHMTAGGEMRLMISEYGEVRLTGSVSPPPPLSLAAVPPVENKALDDLSPGSRASEQALGLDKQGIRDVQARLQVLGHDPNGIDGALGRGSRAAIADWQNRQGLQATGHLNTAQLQRLKEQSQASLQDWLRDPENAKLYVPPPPIAIGSGNIPGNWAYTSNCGANSKVGRMTVRGVFAVQHVGGSRYKGTLRNSQGLNGRVEGTLRGRTVSATTNFGFLLGKVNLNATIDDQRMVMRGRDSNGCSFYARKS